MTRILSNSNLKIQHLNILVSVKLLLKVKDKNFYSFNNLFIIRNQNTQMFSVYEFTLTCFTFPIKILWILFVFVFRTQYSPTQ